MTKEKTKFHYIIAKVRMFLAEKPGLKRYWRAQATRLRKRLENFS